MLWLNRCRDDPDYVDAIRVETALGIPVLRHDEKKPGGIEEVLAFFEGKDPEGGTVSGGAFSYPLGGSFVVQRRQKQQRDCYCCTRKSKLAERKRAAFH